MENNSRVPCWSTELGSGVVTMTGDLQEECVGRKEGLRGSTYWVCRRKLQGEAASGQLAVWSSVERSIEEKAWALADFT